MTNRTHLLPVKLYEMKKGGTKRSEILPAVTTPSTYYIIYPFSYLERKHVRITVGSN